LINPKCYNENSLAVRSNKTKKIVKKPLKSIRKCSCFTILNPQKADALSISSRLFHSPGKAIIKPFFHHIAVFFFV
jgi:hypothetical protein